jgi:hypothetical protein
MVALFAVLRVVQLLVVAATHTANPHTFVATLNAALIPRVMFYPFPQQDGRVAMPLPPVVVD